MKKDTILRTLASFPLVGVVSLASVGLVFGPGAALADGGVDHYYESGYNINAWGGGPSIKAWNGNDANDDFMVSSSVTPGDVNIYDWNGASHYFGYCMGDAGNSPSNAQASLSGSDCTSVAPWGGNFVEVHCSGTDVAFYNVHWNGYLAPASNSNGAQFYLNGKATCYHVAPQ